MVRFRFTAAISRHAAFRALPPRHQCRTPYLQMLIEPDMGISGIGDIGHPWRADRPAADMDPALADRWYDRSPREAISRPARQAARYARPRGAGEAFIRALRPGTSGSPSISRIRRASPLSPFGSWSEEAPDGQAGSQRLIAPIIRGGYPRTRATKNPAPRSLIQIGGRSRTSLSTRRSSALREHARPIPPSPGHAPDGPGAARRQASARPNPAPPSPSVPFENLRLAAICIVRRWNTP